MDRFFYITLICFATLCTTQGLSQSLMRSSVGMAGSSTEMTIDQRAYFVSQSIGQASITGTITKNGRTLRQGFQQPLYQIRTGVQSIGKLNARIYPNPSKRWLNILFKEELSDEISLSLYDNTGRLIVNEKYNASASVKLDITTVNNGIYVLKAISGRKQLITTIVKQ
ncbi:MAG: T9SS type A sorting domain-containing protein [Bacteroidota bacterium]